MQLGPRAHRGAGGGGQEGGQLRSKAQTHIGDSATREVVLLVDVIEGNVLQQQAQ